MGSPDLPADPTPAQLDAWLELAEMATDEDFVATTRRNAMWAPTAAGAAYDPDAFRQGYERAMELAHEAVDAGIEPQSAAARPAVDAVVAAFATATGRPDTPKFRAWLREQGERHTDPRAARYWELVNIVRGAPAPEDRATSRPGSGSGRRSSARDRAPGCRRPDVSPGRAPASRTSARASRPGRG